MSSNPTQPAPDSLLAQTGVALWGSRWQSDLARELGVSDRTVRRWVAGTETPRDGVYHDLARICRERSGALSEIANRLMQAHPQQ
jgi:hypothetical protein